MPIPNLEVLESINKTLTPSADFTDMLSGEKYVTFLALAPLLKHITDDVLCENEEDTTLTADIKRQIITYLQDKYEDTELKELLSTSFLDPRFKTEYIPNGNIPAITETSPPPAKKNVGKYFKEDCSLKLHKKR